MNTSTAHFSSSMDASVAGSEAENKYALHELVGEHNDAYALGDASDLWRR